METQRQEALLPSAERIEPSRQDSLRAIRSTAWGAGLPEPTLDLMLDYVRPRRIARGAVVCEEGTRGDFMAFVLSGRLRVTKRDYFQEAHPLALLGAGDSFGEMALVDDEPRSASIEAVEDTGLLILTAEDFRRLLADQPEAANALLFQVSRVLSRRVRFLNQRVLERLI